MNNNYWMMNLCLIGLTACGGGGSSSPSAPASSYISTNQYMPAQHNAVWQYSDDNTGQSYQVTSSPVTIDANGIETFSLNWVHSGFTQSFEYKDDQLNLKGLTFNQVWVNGVHYKAHFDISNTPFTLLPAYAELGGRLDTSYTSAVTTITPDIGPAYTNVLPIWKNHGIETIVTQHGYYEAVHIEFTLAFDVTVDTPAYGTINLDQVSLMQELWFSPGIGIVKIKDSSSSITYPAELSLDSFNRYRDQDDEIASLPVAIEIDEKSPWKNLHKAFGIEAFYGTWAETTNQCSPVPSDNARYQLALSQDSYTLTKVTYQDGDCSINGTNVFKTESVKSGDYTFINNGQPSNTLSLKLSVQSESLREQRPDSPWSHYYDGTSGVEESISLKKTGDNQLKFEIYDWGSMHTHTLNYAP
ncbi:hypothetical protein AB6D81_13165 [Vibrio splendidus]|uniref:hypothetical protein n=1 Tax=Vibrio splendidus TaxID=29497 RepID=UPI000C84FF4A|nr:hypothetical protein [Vibrio splendidus]PMG63278.1 hypothetical protein BCU89_01515 [Vibrio splendidus]